MNNNRIYKVLLTVCIFLSVSCSTEKNTLVNRSYHQLTAYYNVYFNGNEALKQGLAKADERIAEDYTHILPLYKECVPQVGELVSSDMDIAVEKASKLVKLHSMTKPPKKKSGHNRKKIKKEYNRFVDDAYILMGRALMYKREFYSAHATFSMVMRSYEEPEIKYEASMWLFRTLINSERYSEAHDMLVSLEKDKDFPKKKEGELAIDAADLNIKENHYEDAIAYLNIGIKKIKNNKKRARYMYILAQLYQETGKREQAMAMYREVIKRSFDYEMKFNARISSAKVLSDGGNIAELKRELNKMKKKKRNQPYLDQIYYALGNIAQTEGKTPEAISLYKQSVATSTTNIYQRALSSITLSDIYFSQREYVPSGTYLDSAMVIIDENYPNYEVLSERYESLSELVRNLNVVTTEDSLQHLASLSETELNALIEKWIEQEKNKENGGVQNVGSGSYYTRARRSLAASSSSSWYFYNPSTVAYGKKEFKQKWGDRKLDDNWRRSDKTESSFSEDEELAEGGDSIVSEDEDIVMREEDPLKPEYYKQDIPNNDSLMALSHEKIKDALYNAGVLLKNVFEDYEQSAECFLELDKRYPENIYKLPCYFNLWDLCQSMGKIADSNHYKDWIIDHYPDSHYAKFLLNPNYFVELEAQREEINKFYLMAFSSYKYRDFNNAKKFAKQALALRPDSSSLSKIDFIRMVSESRLMAPNRFADSLRAHVNVYPNSETVELANQILGLIKEDKLSNYGDLVESGYLNDVIKNLELLDRNFSITEESLQKWDRSEDLLHYFVISFPNNAEIDVNRLKFDLANYNLDHYTSRDFDIEVETLNSDYKLLIVRNFDSKESAMIYFLSIIRKPEVFRALANADFFNFIVSNNNYRQMLSDKSHNDYLGYFAKNYSTFTKGQFSEEELASPEKLMAKQKSEDQELLQEKGEYVVVETGAGSEYQPDIQESEIFKLDYNSPHSVAVFIEQRGFRTANLMRAFVQFNSKSYAGKKLRVTPASSPEGTMLLVSSFANALDARSYLVEINDEKSLFQSIGDIKYSTFSISRENTDVLKRQKEVEAYKEFHHKNYMQRRPSYEPKSTPVVEPKSQPQVSTEPVKEEVKTTVESPKKESVVSVKSAVKPSVNDTLTANVSKSASVVEPKSQPQVPTESVKEEAKTTAEAKPDAVSVEPAVKSTTEAIASEKKDAVETKAESKEVLVVAKADTLEKGTAEAAKKEVLNLESNTTAAVESKEAEPEPEIVAEPETVSEDLKNDSLVLSVDESKEQPETAVEMSESIYTVSPDSSHVVAIIVPATGFNISLPQAYIKRYNAVTADLKSLGLTTSIIQNIAEGKSALVISAFSDKEKAKAYIEGATNEARVKMSLRSVQYTAVAITSENLKKLQETNNVEDYLEFYEKNYK